MLKYPLASVLSTIEEDGQDWASGAQIAKRALEPADPARVAAGGRPRAHQFPFKAGAEDWRK